MNRLLHWYRLIMEPSGRNLEVSIRMPRRWQGVTADGSRSRAMAYDSACDWVAAYGGRVERARAGNSRAAMSWLPVEDELARRRARLDEVASPDQSPVIVNRSGTNG